MFVTGSFAALPTCLRYQLLQAEFGARVCSSWPSRRRHGVVRSRHLNTTGHRQYTDETQVFDDVNGKDEKNRVSKYPLGRIIGKAGRRQREGRARLKIDSMKKPFEVVVLRDVAEAKEQKKTGPQTAQKPSPEARIRAAQIASEVSGQSKEPSQDEVDESIDFLRPSTSIVDDLEYRDLIKRLLHGYHVRQLHLYLTEALRQSSNEGDFVPPSPEESVRRKGQISTPLWRPGRIPLEKRYPFGTAYKKKETKKSKLAQQIIRAAWNLTIHSEEQQIGEIEVSMKSWQLSYLFHLFQGGKPMYESMIESPFLLRNAEIRPYHPHQIMRITARRQDAEEVVKQLERKLQEVTTSTIDLTCFKPLLGKPGWPKGVNEIFQ